LFKVLVKYSKYVTESRFIFAQTLTERLFFFLLFLVFARTNSNELYGEIVTVFAISNAVAYLFNLGLPIYIQKETSAKKDNITDIYTESVFFQIVFYFVFLFFILLIFNSLYNISVIFVILISSSVYALQFAVIPVSVLYGVMKFRISFISLFLIRMITISFIVIVSFVFFNSVEISLVLLLASSILFLLVQLLYVRIKVMRFSLYSVKFNKIIKTLSVTLPLYLAVVFNYLYDKIDIIVISKILNFSEVSLYNIGYGIYKSSTLVFGFLLAGGFSRISYLSRNKKAVKIFMNKYFKIIIFITSITAVVLFIFSDLIITNLYGEKYSGSAIILRILTPAIILLGLNNLTGNILNALGLFRENMFITLSGLIFNIAANVIFIKYYGIIISAVITILTEFLILFGDIIVIKNNFDKE